VHGRHSRNPPGAAEIDSTPLGGAAAGFAAAWRSIFCNLARVVSDLAPRLRIDERGDLAPQPHATPRPVQASLAKPLRQAGVAAPARAGVVGDRFRHADRRLHGDAVARG
jgi:hypothetical protein